MFPRIKYRSLGGPITYRNYFQAPSCNISLHQGKGWSMGWLVGDSSNHSLQLAIQVRMISADKANSDI